MDPARREPAGRQELAEQGVSSVIEALLPARVVAEEAFRDPDDVLLYPAEEAVIARAVAKRRSEFATVRHCARKALSRLGAPVEPILPGARGAPQWPAGVVGSMTHCAGYRAAAVAWVNDVATLGVDAEPNEPLPDGVLDIVALDEERHELAQLARDHPAVCWDRLLFSVKESVYKAWFPCTGRWLDFTEAVVTIDPAAGTFAARLLVPGPVLAGSRLTGFIGRWTVCDRLLATAVAVPADGRE